MNAVVKLEPTVYITYPFLNDIIPGEVLLTFHTILQIVWH